jgi:hypothetical protein
VPGALLSALARACAALAAAALLTVASGTVAAQSAQVSIDVPKGEVKTVRLRRLPVGTAVAIMVVSSGKLVLALISASQLKSPQPRALFSGAFERKLSFKVTIPETSDYYLMLDNRRGSEDVSATAAIRVQRRPAKPQPPSPPPGGKDERAGSAQLSVQAAGFPGLLPSRSRPRRS